MVSPRGPVRQRRIGLREAKGKRMQRLDEKGLSRRDMLKLSAGGAGAFVLGASALAVPRGFGSGGGASLYIEAFPTSPLILSPFNDPLNVPKALRPVAKADVDGWASPPAADNQDFVKDGPAWKDKGIPTFELQHGSSNADPETEWLINGQQFDPAKPMISV